MKLTSLLALVALAAPVTANAAPNGRFVLDDGRASAIFPDGAPMKMTMRQESQPGVPPPQNFGPVSPMPPSEVWMDRGAGQTYSVMVMRKDARPYPPTQKCPPPRTLQMGDRSITSTCRLVTVAGLTVAEHRMDRSDGGVTVMRTFESGDHRYTVSFSRYSDKLVAQSASLGRGQPGTLADGQAFLDSFRLEKPATH